MFLEQGVTAKNKFWKYLLGFVLIVIASVVGQVPFSAAVLYETMANKKTYPTNNTMAMQMFDPNLTLFLIMVSFVFVLVGLYFVLKYLHNQSLLSVTTARKKIDWNRVFFSFAIWAIFSILSFFAFYLISPQDFILNFKWTPFFILVLVGVVFIPIQTSAEEYVFRGYLMQGFANLAHNKWFPLLMTSLIFGSLHWANPEVTKFGNIMMVYYIGTGLFLGIITLMDDGIELALGFHAANNLIGALLVSSDWSAFQTDSIFIDKSNPSVGLDVILPVVVVYPILFFIFSKKYNWSNWREKLTGKIKIQNQINYCNHAYKNIPQRSPLF